MVDKVLEEYDKLKSAWSAERSEKHQVQEWARKKDQIHENERLSHQRQLHDLEQKHQRELRVLEQKHQNHVSKMVKGFDEAMKAKNEDHRRQLEELEWKKQSIIEDLKEEKFSREHIKGLADREIVLLFKKLNADIEEFSRIDWNPHHEADWPFSELELRSLRPQNVGKVKQHIVQNCLWLALYECIFRTPFRIIGESGGAFDSSVYEAHSLGRPVHLSCRPNAKPRRI